MGGDPYRHIARLYDALIEPFLQNLRKRALSLYPPQAGMHVLEVGCGTGTFLKLHQQAGCRVYGIERSSAMARAARRKLPQPAQVLQGDGCCLPFVDAVFDRIVLSMLLHEIDPEARPAILSEARRVLKPEGRLVILEYRSALLLRPLANANGFIYLVELAAGRRHFRNFRNFLAAGGLDVLVARSHWAIESQRTVAGGRFELYGLRRRRSPLPPQSPITVQRARY